VQGAVSGAGPPATAIASNDGQSTNWSDGTAGIHTGNATATGNSSSTNITQTVNATTTGSLGGIVLVGQSATVTNTGTASANTGNNTATGNLSDNTATTRQRADPPGLAGDAVAANFGTASNTSNGSASITTGNANAVGNASSTSIAQGVNVSTSGFAIIDQTADVTNAGGAGEGPDARANTGNNTAFGNESDNTATTRERSVVRGVASDSVPGNFGEAKNSSNGSATVHSGNANAVGNAASTSIAQASTGSVGAFALVSQDATVTNTGTAVATTGANFASGNDSDNTATTVERGRTGAGTTTVAGNFGSASNTSNGSASITTGNANAVGSAASTSIAQVDPTVSGSGFALVDQTATVTNVGDARATSGNNTAIGNESDNFALSFQVARTGASSGNTVAANFGTATNTSDGSATITTGDATATGSSSATSVSQVSDVNIGGSGFALVDQSADVTNDGTAVARTGGNDATGNESDNTAVNIQIAVAQGNPGVGSVIASNDGTASNNSNGSATITTGAATASGNVAHTTIHQVDPTIGGAGFVIVTQDATVTNTGGATANSGNNTASGNDSDNAAVNLQLAAVLGTRGTATRVVASNVGNPSNTSDGTASITTGCATATGNTATTTIGQTDASSIDGAGFVIVDQTADVVNSGTARAQTGRNDATGNESDNFVLNGQLAAVTGSGATGSVVASNIGSADNTSHGSASILTGGATASGNVSDTTIDQVDPTIGGAGFVFVTQDATVTNTGTARANSGRNDAVGNDSGNVALNLQAALALGGGGTATNVVASNTSDPSNTSDGSATIVTGCACAVGNTSTTDLGQTADVNIGGAGFAFVDQSAVVTNTGTATANTGRNDAVGNESDNFVLNLQIAVAPGAPGPGAVVASNIGDPSNTSDGSASITTGNAFALGNLSGTGGDQEVAVDGGGFAFVTQTSTTTNFGSAVANSGRNFAEGNDSTNTALNFQLAINPGGIASNIGSASNTSDGTSDIVTGDATAIGNVSATGAALPPFPVPNCGCHKPPVVVPPVVVPPVVVPPVVVVPVEHEVEVATVTELGATVAALPRTGASVFNLVLVGLLLLMMGFFLIWKARRA
jgi:LPXTG-motif cell wall-anchored protein